MTKKEVNRQAVAAAIAEAIATIEAQREIIGEDASNLALFALRHKLAATASEPSPDQQAELVVLAADLSGFTALAEQMDAERVREAMNAMWQVLDAVVASWGGQIDQHAGDGMVALFGLPRPRPNDLERALQTALALQIELTRFNEAARQQQQDWANGWPSPAMRIGVHRGPVYFGKAGVGYGNRRTAVGDTVNVAKALEQAAPLGHVLVSATVTPQLQTQFEIVSLVSEQGAASEQPASVHTNGTTSRGGAPLQLAPVSRSQPAHNLEGPPALQAYQVVAAKHAESSTLPGHIAGQETRWIGREPEQERLEQALYAVMDGRFPQVVTLAAEPGVGSSRLLYEFERRLKLLPERFVLLRGQLDAPAPPVALPLWQEIVFRYGGLRLNDSAGVRREKLARQITKDRTPAQHPSPSPESYRLADSLLLQVANTVDPQALVQAFAGFLQTIGESATIVTFFEHLQQADEESLDLLETLVEQYPDLPLLIFASAEPAFFSQRPAWADASANPFSSYRHVPLRPLSAIDSRHLLAEALQRLPTPPLRLLDLIAAAAQGNPLYMEETVRWLLEQGALSSDGSGRWRVDMGLVEASRLPMSLEELFHVRLQQLPPLEQQVLTTAAAMGRLFYDASLWQETAGVTSLEPPAVETALLSLEKQQLIRANPLWNFANVQAYTFTHPLWQQVAHDRLAAVERQAILEKVALWLHEERRNGQMSHHFPALPLLAHYKGQTPISDARSPRNTAPAGVFVANDPVANAPVANRH